MNDDTSLTRLQRAEREALCKNHQAITVLVDAVRQWREASAKLLASRYRDGECDAVALAEFESAVEGIETAHGLGEAGVIP